MSRAVRDRGNSNSAFLAPTREGRRDPRVDTQLDASLRGSAIGRMKVEVTNISIQGCRVASPFHLHAGDNLVVVLANLAPFGAHVAWCSCDAIGLRFHRPLAKTVINHVIGKQRTIV